MSLSKTVSLALRAGCSFFGGKPFLSVPYGRRGQLVLLFRKPLNPYFFFFLLKNYSAENITLKAVEYKGVLYHGVFVAIPFRVTKKFLFSFRKFSKHHHHLISHFA